MPRGCILAGGRSSRFGSDKALYAVGGVPMAVRIAGVLAEAGLVPVLVARAPRSLGIAELIEPDGPRHPLWGVAFALSFGDAFFTPCDAVDLTADHVRALLGARAVSADQPLLGFLPASLGSRARRFAEEGLAVRAFAAELPTLDLGPITNLNSPRG